MSLNPFSASALCAATGFSFSGKTVFAAAAAAPTPAHKAAGPDAINLLTAGRPIQPAAKLLDNWFNGNSTSVNVNNRPKAAVASPVGDIKMTRSFVAM
jgi:hypothetical protein